MLSARSDLDPSQLFSPFDFTHRRAVIAAISGGSDSLAMLLLLRAWLAREAPRTRLVAVTIDHQLREGSTIEAEEVAAICETRGITHQTLRWIGPKPSFGLAEAAREARYSLLAQAARREASDLIVTGHTADDQAETVAMRQVRGGGRGLAGMAAATLLDAQCWILRPLLTVPRAALRSFLQTQGIGWIDDPTNDDNRFERVRVRKAIEQDNGAAAALLQVAREATTTRTDLGRRAAALIDAHISMPSPGVALVPHAFTTVSDRDAMIYAMQALLAVIGGSRQFPHAERVASLLKPGRGRATLSRTVVERGKAALFVYREARDLPASGPAMEGMVWDGRFRLIVESADELIVTAGAVLADDGESTVVPHSVRAAGLGACPRLGATSGDPAAPVAAQIVPMLAPWARFLPGFDLELAGSLARLAGAAEIPSPPLASHNGEKLNRRMV